MLSNTLVKLLAVFGFATPAVLVGGELYSILQPDTSLWDGFLKIYSVLYIIPGDSWPFASPASHHQRAHA